MYEVVEDEYFLIDVMEALADHSPREYEKVCVYVFICMVCICMCIYVFMSIHICMYMNNTYPLTPNPETLFFHTIYLTLSLHTPTY
jgi:hypothetical protein